MACQADEGPVPLAAACVLGQLLLGCKRARHNHLALQCRDAARGTLLEGPSSWACLQVKCAGWYVAGASEMALCVSSSALDVESDVAKVTKIPSTSRFTTLALFGILAFLFLARPLSTICWAKSCAQSRFLHVSGTISGGEVHRHLAASQKLCGQVKLHQMRSHSKLGFS